MDGRNKVWLYEFLESTMNRDIKEMVKYQRTWNKPNYKENEKVLKEVEPSVRDSMESKKKGPNIDVFRPGQRK